VLAKQAFVVCGSEVIYAFHFLNFVATGFYTFNGYLRVNTMQGCGLPDDGERMWLMSRACQTIVCAIRSLRYYGTAVRMNDLLERLFDLRHLQAKEHVDRLWAITGLLEEKLQVHLASAVDYSEQGRNEYWRAYVHLTKTVLKVGRSLDLLCWPPPITQSNSQLPSWCPDLSQQTKCRMILYSVWNLPSSSKRQRVRRLLVDEDDTTKSQQRRLAIIDYPWTFATTSEQDNLLRVSGFVLDTIVEVVEDARLLGQEGHLDKLGFPQIWSISGTIQAVAIDFYDRALSLARRAARIPADHTKIPPSYLMSFFCDARITAAAESVYRDTLACLTTETADGNNVYYKLDGRQQILADEAMKQFNGLAGHSFFATSKGRFGIAVAGCRAGDKVCSFYGGEPLYVLRRRDDTTTAVSGIGITEFCGVAFIPHLMEQHQRDAAKIGDDEVFVIA
jgi:hypothetical protein